VHAASDPRPATLEADGIPGGFTASEARQAKRLAVVLGIVSGFFVLELGGALVAGSVVLQADALHLLTDVLALGLSLFAMRLAVRRPTPRFTYGLRRAEPVAAIFSALLVLGTTAGIVLEGVEALDQRKAPRAGIMLAVASMALLVNGLSAWLLHDVMGEPHPHHSDADNPDGTSAEGGVVERDGTSAEGGVVERDGTSAERGVVIGEAGSSHGAAPTAKPHSHTLNLRGARLHLLGDTLGAFAAVCAAVVVRFGGHPSADPIASFVVAVILVVGSLRLLRDATHVVFEAAPLHLPPDTIRQIVLGFPGVVGVHDLHVWSLGAGHDAITVHVRTTSSDVTLGHRLSERIRAALHAEYVTVQVEAGEPPSGPPDGP
jgi:cation diffusion facilitator family transporter